MPALIISFIAVLGVAILLYPMTANWFSQLQQAEQIEQLGAQVSHMPPSAREQALSDARSYNAALTGEATVAANQRKPTSSVSADADHERYQSLLRADPTGLMGRLKIPSISVDLPIYHGTSDRVLEAGVGHLEGTALPIGGVGTHAVLTGHRGLASAELFTHLDRLREGDTFTIEVFGEVLTYRIRESIVVEPEKTETLHAQRGQDLATLVTCTPLGINSHRILVTAERVLPTPSKDLANAGKSPEIPGFPWWIILVGVTLAVLAVYVWRSGRHQRTTRPACTPSSGMAE